MPPLHWPKAAPNSCGPTPFTHNTGHSKPTSHRPLLASDTPSAPRPSPASPISPQALPDVHRPVLVKVTSAEASPFKAPVVFFLMATRHQQHPKTVAPASRRPLITTVRHLSPAPCTLCPRRRRPLHSAATPFTRNWNDMRARHRCLYLRNSQWYQLYQHARTDDFIPRMAIHALPAVLHEHVQTVAPTTCIDSLGTTTSFFFWLAQPHA